jgi:hypothetical protein
MEGSRDSLSWHDRSSQNLPLVSRPAVVRHIPRAVRARRKYILFIGPHWSPFGAITMFTASNRTARFASFSFAVLMVVVVNGSMLKNFDNVAQKASLAQNTQTLNVAVLDTVTIVGRRS